jgi:hypothetical protein
MDIAIPLIEPLALGCISDDGANDENSGGHGASSRALLLTRMIAETCCRASWLASVDERLAHDMTQ